VSKQSGSRPSGTTRVLVVEDEAEVLRFLEELLAGHGYEVIEARNGLEAMVALTAADPQLPDVVVLDLGLPLESGVSVLTFLRTVMRSGLPVIVLTGGTDREEEAAVRELGVAAYLRKPASGQEVLAALLRALD